MYIEKGDHLRICTVLYKHSDERIHTGANCVIFFLKRSLAASDLMDIGNRYWLKTGSFS